MSRKNELLAAYVLHARPYRDTSLIVELFTEAQGRVAAVARGARKNRYCRQLQPFAPLFITCSGRGELKTLTFVEPAGRLFVYSGHTLFSGLYVNELMMRLLPVADPCPRIFYLYAQVLAALQEVEGSALASVALEKLLRKFEFSLLDQLGYAVALEAESESGEPLREGWTYRYDAGEGFVRVAAGVGSRDRQNFFAGEELRSIAQSDYSRAEVRRAAKRLIRLALQPHLGNRALKSRELFAQR